MIIQNGNIFTKEGTFREGTIRTLEDKISKLDVTTSYDETNQTTGETIIDARGLYVLPGLVDIHTHGAVGVDFCDAKKEDFIALENYQAQNGITTIFATTMTLPKEKLINIMEKEPSVNPESIVRRDIPLVCGDVLTLKYSNSPIFDKVYEFLKNFKGMHLVDFENKESKIEIIL